MMYGFIYNSTTIKAALLPKKVTHSAGYFYFGYTIYTPNCMKLNKNPSEGKQILSGHLNFHTVIDLTQQIFTSNIKNLIK